MSKKKITIQMADLTDPRCLIKFGLRREGKYMVTDDDEAMVIGEFTRRQMRTIFEREQRRLRNKA